MHDALSRTWLPAWQTSRSRICPRGRVLPGNSHHSLGSRRRWRTPLEIARSLPEHLLYSRYGLRAPQRYTPQNPVALQCQICAQKEQEGWDLCAHARRERAALLLASALQRTDSSVLNVTGRVAFDIETLVNTCIASNEVITQAGVTENSRRMSKLVTYFQQLVDHLCTLVGTQESSRWDVMVPANDPVFTPGDEIELDRRNRRPWSPTCSGKRSQQLSRRLFHLRC